MLRDKKNIDGGEDAHPFRAQQVIDCPVTHCSVPRGDGTMRHSKLNLIVQLKDGTILQRPYNDGPFYVCEREGCEWYKHPRGVHELNIQWVTGATKHKTKRTTPQEVKNDLEVMV